VVVASDGEEALQKAGSEGPDLILLDLVMPGRSGLEICKTLKEQPGTKLIHVLMFTVLGREADKKLSREAGADGHFVKPFTPEDLVTEVQKHLEKARSEKFSKALGLDHTQLRGRKILLEFDPATPYERVVRDFALEARTHGEAVIILTHTASIVHQVVEGEEGVELVPLTGGTILSPILEAHAEKTLVLVFDNLTDLILSMGFQSAYNFTKNALERLSGLRLTAMFLFNPKSHPSNEAYSIRNLFSEQVTYGKDGLTPVKLT
jgi:CheY-like chemotaxis protein